MLQSLIGKLIQVCVSENIIIEGLLSELKDDLLIVMTDYSNRKEIKIIKNFLYVSPVYPDPPGKPRT
jgi:hypothetical protein